MCLSELDGPGIRGEAITTITATLSSLSRYSMAMNGKALLATVGLGLTLVGSSLAAEGTFNSKGVSIRYVTEGQGEAVVLIHGWQSDSGMWGKDQAGNTKLDASGAPGFKVIALDCRGHGKSGKPHDPAKYGAEMAMDVLRLLDHLKIKRAHLVGYSSGAFLIGTVAATAPDRVLSIVYAGQGPLIKGVSSLNFSEADAFAKTVDEGKSLGQYIIDITPANRPKPTLAQAEAYAKFVYGGKDLKALAASGKRFKDLAVDAKALKKCKAPVLFLYGGEESAYVKKCVALARGVLVGSKEKVVAGGDHMTTLIKPEFGLSLVEFLKANKGK